MLPTLVRVYAPVLFPAWIDELELYLNQGKNGILISRETLTNVLNFLR